MFILTVLYCSKVWGLYKCFCTNVNGCAANIFVETVTYLQDFIKRPAFI